MRSPLASWWFSSWMNAICYGEMCVGMSGAKQTNALKFPSLISGVSKLTGRAINLSTQQCFIQAYKAGNSESTIAFLQYLRSLCPHSRIALLWDGATYHRSQEVRAYLGLVNLGLDEYNWKITCIRFAPNAPQQNPIEDIWLQAKRLIRECYHLCKSFDAVKFLFEFVTHLQIFNFPKLFTYGCSSQLI